MNIEKIRFELAKETDLKADLIVPVPDSGVPCCIRFCGTSTKKI